MSGPLEPVRPAGPGPRRALIALLAAAALVAGAALAGSGFPIAFEASTALAPNRTGPASSSPRVSSTGMPTSFSPPTAACPASPAPPPDLEVTQPAPGSTWSTEGPLPIAGTGAPTTGHLIASLDEDTGAIIRRVAADGSFAADLIVYPVPGPSRARLTIGWAPVGAPDTCLRTVATVDFTLDPVVPISVWLVGGPPRRLPGPPYGFAIAALPSVTSIAASLASAGGGPSVEATVYPGEVVAKRARPFMLTFPDSLPRGAAVLDVRWTGPVPGELRLPVVVVEPEVETP